MKKQKVSLQWGGRKQDVQLQTKTANTVSASVRQITTINTLSKYSVDQKQNNLHFLASISFDFFIEHNLIVLVVNSL